MPTARLAAIADAQCEQIAAPVEIRPRELAMSGVQFAEARQAGEQIGRATQHFLQVFGRIGRHLAAKTTRGHVEKQLAAHLAQIDSARRHVHELQGLRHIKRHSGSTGKIVGSAQRQDGQTGLGFSQRQGFGNVTQGAVTAARHNMPVPGRQRFIDQTLRIARLPGQPNIQLPALLALVCDSITHVFVE